jgi:hypothetical protein
MAGDTVFTSDVQKFLKKTLGAVWTDKNPSAEVERWRGWVKEESMRDQFEDDEPMAGPGLAAEVDEGEEIPTRAAGQHVGHRYRAVKRGARMILTEEAIEDNRYGEAANYANMLRTSLEYTKEVACCQMLARGFNTNHPMVDSQPLWSTAQTLRGGGTFSNQFATAMAPSVAALIVLDTMAGTMVGLHGLKAGYEIGGIACPYGQRMVWNAIMGSDLDPAFGNSSKVNVVKKYMNIDKVHALPYWDNTETNWAGLLKVQNGFKCKVRRKIKPRTYVDNSGEFMNHQASERYDVGCSDPRASIGSNA